MPYNSTNFKEQDHFDKLVETTGETWWGRGTKAGIMRSKRRALLVAKELARFKDPAVLELGCGTGSFTKFILEEQPSLRLTGCDISPRAVSMAKDQFRNYRNAVFAVANVTSLNFENDTFDAVIGCSILHHLPAEPVLRGCLRVLKPGGIIWFSEPNMMNPQVAIERNIRVVGRLLQNTEDESAFFRWSLAKTLRSIGFGEVSVEPFDFLHPILPSFTIKGFDSLGRFLEKVPFVKEIAGSLLICARKPL